MWGRAPSSRGEAEEGEGWGGVRGMAPSGRGEAEEGEGGRHAGQGSRRGRRGEAEEGEDGTICGTREGRRGVMGDVRASQ